MRIVAAKEHSLIPIRVDESTRLRRDVLRSGWVQMRAAKGGWSKDDSSFSEVPLELHAGSVVGLLPLTEDISVLVEPRFPANLTVMVNAIGRSAVPLDIVREYQTSERGEAAEWMLDLIVNDFLGAAEAVSQQGLLRTYTQRYETTSSPRGRILLGPTMKMQASRGVGFAAKIAFFERTEENPPNQALVEALHWVLRRATGQGGPRSQRGRAAELLHRLRYVPRDREGKFQRDEQVQHPNTLPEVRSAYRRALPLALALIERRGFSLDAAEGEMALSSLLVKTDEVFESYARMRLSEYLPDRSLRVVDGNQMPTRYLYSSASPEDIPAGATMLPLNKASIKPDVLIEDSERTRLVVDMKYKPINGHADRDDVIEQLVTYAHRLGCPRALSLHPTQEDQPSGLFVAGRVGATTIYNYRVNLGATDLEAEMRAMADALGSLC